MLAHSVVLMSTNRVRFGVTSGAAMTSTRHPFGQVELRDLRAFVAVAETGSVSRAAEQIGLTQSRVSQQLKALEGSLGVQLFARVGRRVVLTSAGRAFQVQAVDVLQRMDAACRAIAGLDSGGGVTGHLRVGVVPACNTHFMPTILSRFIARHPGCTLLVQEVSARDIERRLETGQLDVGVGFLPKASPSLRYQRLLREKFALVVRRDHPFAKRRHVPFADLHELALVLLPARFYMRQEIDQALATHKVRPRVVLELDSLPAILLTVQESGLGTLLPPFVVPASDTQQLVCIALDGRQPFVDVGWMAPKGGRADALVERFAAVAAEVIGERPSAK